MAMQNDVSESVLKLLDSGRISWPRSASDRNKFITDNLGKVWDGLLNININANAGVFSNLDNIDNGYVSYDDHNSAIAWDILGKVLLLVLSLEDALGIDITPSLEYDKPMDFSVMKAKIRSRIQS